MWFHVQLDQKNLKRTLIKRLVLDDLDFSFTNLSHFYRYVIRHQMGLLRDLKDYYWAS